MPRPSRSQPADERTEEERERAREERARRRASQSSAAESPPDAEPAAVEPPPEPPEPPRPIPPIPPVGGPPDGAAAASTDLSPRRPMVAASSGVGRPRRSPLTRTAALLALAAAVVAVILLFRSLLDSRSTKASVVPPAVVKVLIPEGKTRLQIAQIAAGAGLAGSYRSASVHSALLDPTRYGAPRGTADLEGFLFPATYDMDVHAPARRLVDEQLLAFRENFGSTEIRRARDLHVTPYGLLTVASMVEREAQVPGDRPKIAAVIYNRLREGMPLGIDATIYYAVELRNGIATYTHELTEAQLHIDSPYNTRTHTGLPPTPISNPGLASIRAAAYPAHVPYLYYVAAADGCGRQVFSTTLAEFEANDAAYKAAVSRNAGHPPSCGKK